MLSPPASDTTQLPPDGVPDVETPADDGGSAYSHFLDISARNGIHITSAQGEILRRYVSLLVRYNARVNLISRKDQDFIWRNHILHSLALLTRFPLREGGTYLDLGTGGGLPGIPLSILSPRAAFILCDSIRKKVEAVRSFITELGLPNVRTVCWRAGEGSAPAEVGQVDAVFARAVSDLRSLCRSVRPLLRESGDRVLVAWKGGDLSDEIRPASKMKGIQSIVEEPIVLAGESYFMEEGKKLVFLHFQAADGAGRR